MNTKTLMLFLALSVICGVLIGLPIGRATVQCRPCPETTVTVAARDTTIPRPPILVTVPRDTSRPMPAVPRPPKPHIEAPQPVGAMIAGVDEQTIYYPEYDKTMPDSARVVVKFPTADPPGDILVEYTPSPIVRLIERERIVREPCAAPSRFGWTVGPYAGLGVGLDGRPVATAGLAVMFGYRFLNNK